MKRLVSLFLVISAACVVLTLAGCSQKDSDTDYGEAYDVDYMVNEYVDQLLRDGAETVVGNVEITGSEDDYTVTVAEKKVVANENYKNGYYVADKNISSSYTLGSDLGILTREGNEIRACSAEEFIQNHSGDTETLYTVYLIGDVVELIQPLDPETAAASEN